VWQASSLVLRDPADRDTARALLEERAKNLEIITRFLIDASSGLKQHISSYLRYSIAIIVLSNLDLLFSHLL
jgi:hypothetical protein